LPKEEPASEKRLSLTPVSVGNGTVEKNQKSGG